MDRTGTRKRQIFKALREKAEHLLKEKEPQRDAPAPDLLTLIHELEIHQIELELQNDELKLAQLEISRLHREYEMLYEFAPCGYFILNSKGIISKMNLTGVTLLNQERERLHYQLFGSLLDQQGSHWFAQAMRRAAQTGEVQTLECRLDNPGPAVTWLRVHIRANHKENHELSDWFVIAEDITHWKKAADQEHRTAAVNATLFRELEHRVKNSLALVSSLIHIQMRKADNAGVSAALQVIDHRVMSISNLYRHLYNSGLDSEQINLDAYLHSVLKDLQEISRDLPISAKLIPVTVSFNTALALGLIMNELITNVMKHTVQDSVTEKIAVRLKADKASISLTVQNSAERGGEFSAAGHSGGRGLEIVALLCEQLGGVVDFGGDTYEHVVVTVPRVEESD